MPECDEAWLDRGIQNLSFQLGHACRKDVDSCLLMSTGGRFGDGFGQFAANLY